MVASIWIIGLEQSYLGGRSQFLGIIERFWVRSVEMCTYTNTDKILCAFQGFTDSLKFPHGLQTFIHCKSAAPALNFLYTAAILVSQKHSRKIVILS